MSFLLDTNICSEHLRRPRGLTHRFVQHAGRLFIPTIVLGELYAWAHRRPRPDELIRIIEQDLLVDLGVLDYDQAAAREFGRLRGLLMDRGVGVNPVDLMIAAVARTHDLILVTHNRRHFDSVPDLRVEDWLD